MGNCCGVEPIEKRTTLDERENSEKIFLSISGMGCMSCANRVRNSLLLLLGVVEAQVDHMRGIAQVVFNPQLTNPSEMFQAVVRAGGDGRHNYSARLISR
jgi:copper chaperone CopZ